ncbi:hypothetical protein KAT08_00730 [Candidatus Babeliales bacterium]|nr:hypothetical protein [Candidatus Babeliales bacterium]
MKIKNLNFSIYLILLHLMLNTSLSGKIIKLGIFDTCHNEKYRYQHFIDIAQSTNFNVEYKSIGQVLDFDFKKSDLKKYDGILFIFDTEFLISGIKNNSVVVNKILKILNIFSSIPRKLIYLAFDTFLAPRILKQNINIILNKIFYNSSLHKISNPISNSLNSFFKIPMEARSRAYHTTLSNPSFKVHQIKPLKSFNAITLPIKKEDISPTIKYTLPYGLYIYNKEKQNHIFITSKTILSGFGVTENFRFCPMDFDLRKQIYNSIQQMMWELNKIITSKEIAWKLEEQFKKPIKNDIRKIKFTKKISLPKSLEEIGHITKEKKDKLTKVSWMQINFFEHPEKNVEKINRLIKSILKSGSNNYLWISSKINMIFSDIAIYGSQNDKNNLVKSFKNFTKKLSKKAKELKIEPPKILIGFEIANNIRKANKKITQPMILSKYTICDLYGNIFPYCTNLINENFWEQEIKQPLSKFLDKLEKSQINNDVKIAGIALDFEPYFGQFPSHFFGTVGFNHQNLITFDKTIKWKILPQKTQNNIIKLMKEKNVEKYFNFIEDKANSIGNNLKNFVNKKIPGGIIGCYIPQFLIEPFYKGFYKGLGDKEKPFLLMTFNVEPHKKWLEKNKIYAKHLTALMLGKLNDKEFEFWLNYFDKHQLNFWLNRFSKFMDIKTKGTDNEQPYISEKKRPNFFNLLKKM